MKNNFDKLKKCALQDTPGEISHFDPDGVGIANGNFFGLPCSREEAEAVIVQVPWDATVSYGNGTAEGPAAMLEASLQIDLFDEKLGSAGGLKLWTLPLDEGIAAMNLEARAKAEEVIDALSAGSDGSEVADAAAFVNEASAKLNSYVEGTAEQFLAEGKFVALVGGEHSVPLGLVKALSRRYEKFGVLHIDAHSDTRKAYEGFTYSHASIMYNIANEVSQVEKIVQVGIRDFCAAECRLITESDRFEPFTDFRLNDAQFSGETWKDLCGKIVDALPENVYISFDIDGLSPEYCPNTGTPVPGGLSFAQADYLIYTLRKSGKKIIGLDLCEVAPDTEGEWDANVGARILFKMLLYSCLG